MSEMNPKLASQQTNLMLGGAAWEPSTTARETFTWPDGAAGSREAKEAAAALKKTYYKAHFELGADATDYTSCAQRSYSQPAAQKRYEAAQDRAMRTQANFYFGLEQADMRSMATTDFDKKTVDVSATRKTAAKLKKDLRSSHFEFGADPPTMQSSSAAAFGKPRVSYVERVENQREIKVNTTLLRAQNFDTPTHTFYAETSGKQPDPRDYPGSYTSNKAELQRMKKTLQRTNFALGESELDYRTEAMMMTGQKKKALHQPFTVTLRDEKK